MRLFYDHRFWQAIAYIFVVVVGMWGFNEALQWYVRTMSELPAAGRICFDSLAAVGWAFVIVYAWRKENTSR